MRCVLPDTITSLTSYKTWVSISRQGLLIIGLRVHNLLSPFYSPSTIFHESSLRMADANVFYLEYGILSPFYSTRKLDCPEKRMN